MPSLRIGGRDRDLLLVDVFARSHPDCSDFWDGNWLDTKVSVTVAAFTGSYRASLRSDEFARFLHSLRLLSTLQGTELPSQVAGFAAMEEQLSIVVRGTGQGHFVAHCVAVDALRDGDRLEFRLAFDQTDLPAMMDGLESILEAFPVLGSPSG